MLSGSKIFASILEFGFNEFVTGIKGFFIHLVLYREIWLIILKKVEVKAPNGHPIRICQLGRPDGSFPKETFKINLVDFSLFVGRKKNTIQIAIILLLY